jgi:hypothetical protein
MVDISLLERGFHIREAILVSESWVVSASEGENYDNSPSRYPNHKEAFALVGRNTLELCTPT